MLMKNTPSVDVSSLPIMSKSTIQVNTITNLGQSAVINPTAKRDNSRF